MSTYTIPMSKEQLLILLLSRLFDNLAAKDASRLSDSKYPKSRERFYTYFHPKVFQKPVQSSQYSGFAPVFVITSHQNKHLYAL